MNKAFTGNKNTFPTTLLWKEGWLHKSGLLLGLADELPTLRSAHPSGTQFIGFFPGVFFPGTPMTTQNFRIVENVIHHPVKPGYEAEITEATAIVRDVAHRLAARYNRFRDAEGNSQWVLTMEVRPQSFYPEPELIPEDAYWLWTRMAELLHDAMFNIDAVSAGTRYSPEWMERTGPSFLTDPLTVHEIVVGGRLQARPLEKEETDLYTALITTIKAGTFGWTMGMEFIRIARRIYGQLDEKYRDQAAEAEVVRRRQRNGYFRS